MNYSMFSDEALVKFRSFCDAAGFTKPPSPQGAFYLALPKAVTRKEPAMSYRYVPVPHCGDQLFLRERSSNLAFDEATEITTSAKDILKFLRDKISDEALRHVEELLKMEAGVPTDSEKKADAMTAGAKERRGAQDSSFNKLFPGADRIGRVV